MAEIKNLQIYEEIRPWGSFRRFTQNEKTTVKLLTIKSGEQFSLQSHAKRSEFWKVVSGTPEVTHGEEVTLAKPGDEFFIEAGEKHRIKGISGDAVVLEISLGEFDEADITRLEDDYDRK